MIGDHEYEYEQWYSQQEFDNMERKHKKAIFDQQFEIAALKAKNERLAGELQAMEYQATEADHYLPEAIRQAVEPYKAEIARLRAALEFYADKQTYIAQRTLESDQP